MPRPIRPTSVENSSVFDDLFEALCVPCVECGVDQGFGSAGGSTLAVAYQDQRGAFRAGDGDVPQAVLVLVGVPGFFSDGFRQRLFGGRVLAPPRVPNRSGSRSRPLRLSRRGWSGSRSGFRPQPAARSTTRRSIPVTCFPSGGGSRTSAFRLPMTISVRGSSGSSLGPSWTGIQCSIAVSRPVVAVRSAGLDARFRCSLT